VAIEFDQSKIDVGRPATATALAEIDEGVIPYLEFSKRNISQVQTFTDTRVDAVPFPKDYDDADFTITIDEKLSRTGNLLQLFKSRLQGINYTPNSKDGWLKIRGESAGPLVLIDEIPIDEYLSGLGSANTSDIDSVSNESIVQFLSQIDTESIRLIELHRSSPGLQRRFGADATNGLVSIYSKKTRDQVLQEEINKFSELFMPGYTVPEHFINPDYVEEVSRDHRPNRRATVYWNPNVKTNKKGRAKIGFYNTDNARTLQICIEGITDDGVPVYSTYEIGRNTGRAKVN